MQGCKLDIFFRDQDETRDVWKLEKRRRRDLSNLLWDRDLPFWLRIETKTFLSKTFFESSQTAHSVKPMASKFKLFNYAMFRSFIIQQQFSRGNSFTETSRSSEASNLAITSNCR